MSYESMSLLILQKQYGEVGMSYVYHVMMLYDDV